MIKRYAMVTGYFAAVIWIVTHCSRLPRNNCCSHRNYIRFQILAFGEVVMRDKPNNGWVEESICRADNWTNFLCWTRILKQIRVICLKGSAFLLSVQYPVLPCVIHAFENTKLNCSGAISCIIPVGRFLINNWTLTRHLLIVKNLEHFFFQSMLSPGKFRTLALRILHVVAAKRAVIL